MDEISVTLKLLNQRQLLRRLNVELWTKLLQVNQELADFEAEYEKLEGKYSIKKNNIDKRLKNVEKTIKEIIVNKTNY